MKNIIEKFKEQDKKTARIRERELNRSCLLCRKSLRENGFGSIPRVCKICENSGAGKQ